MDNTGLIAAISGILAFLISYFDKGEKKYEIMRDTYFENVLQEFHIRYVENNNINSIKFINRNYRKSDSYIPRYVFYLVEKKEKEKLKMVLLDDYLNYYPNYENSSSNTFAKLAGKIYIIELFVISFMSIFMALYIIHEFYRLTIIIYDLTKGRTGSNNFNMLGIIMPDWVSCSINIIIMLMVLVVPMYLIKNIISINDDYTLKRSAINKIINKKVSRFKRNSKRFKIFKRENEKYYI